MFGTVSTASYAGAFLGTALAIYIQTLAGWRWVFVPSAAVGLAVSSLTFIALKTPNQMNIEIPGKIITYYVCMTCLCASIAT